MKQTGKIIMFSLLAVILILGVYVISGYNRFVALDQDINGKWSEVENQYQRQADLIPNLVSIVSSAVKTETSFVKDVTEARSRWQSAQGQMAKDTAGIQMSNGISALVNAVAVSEDYPVLQANKQYVALTDEVSGTQNRITVARGRYIDSIKSFNIAVKSFPSNVLASVFGFSAKEYYQAAESSMTTPKLGTGVLP